MVLKAKLRMCEELVGHERPISAGRRGDPAANRKGGIQLEPQTSSPLSHRPGIHSPQPAVSFLQALQRIRIRLLHTIQQEGSPMGWNRTERKRA